VNFAGNIVNFAGNIVNFAGNIVNFAGNIVNFAGNIVNFAGNILIFCRQHFEFFRRIRVYSMAQTGILHLKNRLLYRHPHEAQLPERIANEAYDF